MIQKPIENFKYIVNKNKDMKDTRTDAINQILEHKIEHLRLSNKQFEKLAIVMVTKD